MPISLSTIRTRVQSRIRDLDGQDQTFSPIEVDQAIADTYLVLASRLPSPWLHTANAFTISAGADTFTLPATVTGYTGGDGEAEYTGGIQIQLVSTGMFLTPRTMEQLDAIRNGSPSVVLGVPDQFALYEGATQVVNGRCYPGATAAQVCNLDAMMLPDDLRDYVGAGTSGMDQVEINFSRFGSTSLVLYTAADLLERMTPTDLAKRALSREAAPNWIRQAEVLLYQEGARRHDLESTGRIQRWVG